MLVTIQLNEGTNMEAGNQQKYICYWALLQKHEFMSWRTHEHESNTFPNKMTVQIAKSPSLF